MTITRVIRDDVEFFTVDATGESGMSETGLAHLCGVSSAAVNKILRTTVLTWEQDGSLEPRQRRHLSFKLADQRKTSDCQFLNIKILSAELCARVIQYYAFESKNKTEEALFAF